MDRLLLKAPAKINLRLKVVGKREDGSTTAGYHDLDMIMIPLTVADEIILEPTSSEISFECDHPKLQGEQDNLVLKAARYARDHWGFSSGLHIRLKKQIPLAAGLGGGSSDAAAVLKGIAHWMERMMNPEEYSRIAHTIGADVPFFLASGPQRVEGIGEVMTPLEMACDLPLILVNPGVAVSTQEVFQALKMRLTSKNPSDSFPWAFDRLADLCQWMENDLEDVTCSQHAVVRQLKKSLIECGASHSLMSGSGPTVFGVFASKAKRNHALDQMKKLYPSFWVQETELAR
jgi:4-diphosphocytidyl-2-C-methyl-D-erythritol kinase